MFSNQIVPYNNPSLVATPFIDQVSQGTAHMQAICAHNDAIKKFQALTKDCLDQNQLHIQHNDLGRLPIMQIQQRPRDHCDINWQVIPRDLDQIVLYFSLLTGWNKIDVLVTMLGYINSAMRGRYKVSIRPEWDEPVIIYQMIIANPGQNKSLLHKQMNAPLEKFQGKLMSEYLSKKSSVEQHSESIEQGKRILRSKLLKNALKKSQDDDTVIDVDMFSKEVLKISKELAQIPGLANTQLASPAFLADGFTEKKLIRLMAGAGGGQAIIQPEGTTLIKQIKDSKFNAEIFLKSYGMEDFSDGTVPGGIISVTDAFLNILVFLQPGVAAELYKNPKLMSSGLPARFLPYFVLPTGAPCAAPESLNREAAAAYFHKLTSMLERNYTQECMREIFSIKPEISARQHLEGYHNWIRNNMQFNSHDSLKFFDDKLAGTAARIAGILHAWRYDEPEKHDLSLMTMQAGIQIATALRPHASYALSPVGFQAVDDAKKILEWVRRHRNHAFTSRDIAQNSGVRTVDKIFPALDLLEQHNILTQLSVPNKPRMCLMHPLFK